jgi:hypothetical protein
MDCRDTVIISLKRINFGSFMAAYKPAISEKKIERKGCGISRIVNST